MINEKDVTITFSNKYTNRPFLNIDSEGHAAFHFGIYYSCSVLKPIRRKGLGCKKFHNNFSSRKQIGIRNVFGSQSKGKVEIKITDLNQINGMLRPLHLK